MGADFRAIGGLRGRLVTKIHLVMDGAARILAVAVAFTPGQMGDLRPAHGPPANLPPPARSVAAYDSNGLRNILLGRGTTPVIPNNPPRKNPQPFDARAYRARNIMERTIGRLKACRRIHTRYDKLAANFASAVAIAVTLPGWTWISLEPRALHLMVADFI